MRPALPFAVIASCIHDCRLFSNQNNNHDSNDDDYDDYGDDDDDDAVCMRAKA